MKKLFTLMLAMVCALFVGVSCTPNGDEPAPEVKAVNFEALDVLPCGAGTVNLNYTLTEEVIGSQLVLGEPSAAWLKVQLPDEGNYVVLTYEKNLNAPNSEPRVATFEATYGDKAPVTVTVKQASTTEVAFTVAFDEEKTTHEISYYTCDAADDNMSYVIATDNDIKGMNVTGDTYAEMMKNYISTLASYGMLTEEYLPYGYWFKGDVTEPRETMRYSATPATLLAVGFVATMTDQVDEWGSPIFNVEFTTAVHEWNVPFKGYPEIVIENLEHTVNCAAGTLELACSIANPLANTEEATYATKVETEATWVVPTWADGKLTLAYEANTTALPRSAEIELNYGQAMTYYFMGAAETKRLTLTQEADSNATKVTFDIEVVESHFNCIVVNVTPSDLEATYVLNVKSVQKDENDTVVEENWANVVVSNMRYPGNLKFFTGKLENHVIQMNPTSYQWDGYDYYVYAFATDAEKTAPLCEPSVITTTVDASDMPSVAWNVEKSGLVWSENNNRYDLEVVEGSNVVLYFNVTNPVEGASLKLNYLYDSYNVLDGDPVIDNAAGTITMKIDAYDDAKRYHYISPTFVYTNEAGDTWGITAPTLRITQVEAPAVTELVITPDQIASLNKAGSYYLADGTNQDITNEATWLKWAVSGINLEACRAMVSTADGYQGLFQFQGDASTAAKQGFLGNATSNGEIKQVVIEAYSTYATPSFDLYYGDAKLPNDKSKVLDVAQNCTKGASQGMIGNYECFSFTCTFEIPAGNEFFAVRNDSKGATYIKSITVKY